MLRDLHILSFKQQEWDSHNEGNRNHINICFDSSEDEFDFEERLKQTKRKEINK